MRIKSLAVAAGVLVGLLTVSGVAAAAPPSARVRIAPVTSPFFLYDPNPLGPLPGDELVPAVRVRATLRHCPAAGVYLRQISLVQDGIDYPWATTALGAEEIVCAGEGATADAGIGFFGATLHPGRAHVSVTIVDERSGELVAQRERDVVIPWCWRHGRAGHGR